MTLGPNVIKRFTVVIYHHPMVILSFCAKKLSYCGMEVNYHGILTLEIIAFYCGNLPWYFNLRNNKVKKKIHKSH